MKGIEPCLPKSIDNKLSDGDIKNWYVTAVAQGLPLASIIQNFEQQGYVLDSCGLLFRKPFTDNEIKEIGHTILDIVFPRPSTFHSHPDVVEAAIVKSGAGLYFHKNNEWRELKPGVKLITPKNYEHGYMPAKNNFLEIQLFCSGIIDTTKECEFLSVNGFAEYMNKYFPSVKA